jgi:hypothetical protein
VPNRIQRIVLAWSKADLENMRPGDRVVSLTSEAFVASSGLNGERVHVHLGDPEATRVDSGRILNELHEALKSSPFPWLEAYANVNFSIKAFQFITWLRLIRSLQQQFSPAQLEVYPPRAFSEPSLLENTFIYCLAQRSFGLAQEILQREGIRFVAPASAPLSRSEVLGRSFLGRIVASIASKTLAVSSRLLRGGGRRTTLPDRPEADVLLVSQQYTDSYHAAPLAKHLANKFRDRLAWIGMRPRSAANMSQEENDLVANVDLDNLRFVDSDSLLSRRERDSKLSLLVDIGNAWRLAGRLTSHDQLGVARRDWFEFLMDPSLRGLARRYEAWKEVLGALHPRVVIGLSAKGDMGLIRAWTRRNDVPFVQFMHGVFPIINSPYHVDADYLGVFGSILATQVKNSGLQQPRSVVACGAMQFRDKVLSASRKSSNGNGSSGSNSVLFLGGFELLPFYPWSPADMWRMLRDLHQVCEEFGKVLRVRTHPRYPATFWTPYVNKLHKQSQETIILSSEPSIHRDIRTAEFIVAPVFNGAALDALMGGKLIISYLPEGVEHTDSSRPLESMGGVAHGFKELQALFSAVATNSSSVCTLRLGQKQFLKDYSGNVKSDHWKTALNLVDEALRYRSHLSDPRRAS